MVRRAAGALQVCLVALAVAAAHQGGLVAEAPLLATLVAEVPPAMGAGPERHLEEVAAPTSQAMGAGPERHLEEVAAPTVAVAMGSVWGRLHAAVGAVQLAVGRVQEVQEA